jgi:hypothetical protein
MKVLYGHIDFFGFVLARTPDDSFKLSRAKEEGRLKSLDQIEATKNAFNAAYMYTYADNRYELKISELGYIIKS